MFALNLKTADLLAALMKLKPFMAPEPPAPKPVKPSDGKPKKVVVAYTGPTIPLPDTHIFFSCHAGTLTIKQVYAQERRWMTLKISAEGEGEALLPYWDLLKKLSALPGKELLQVREEKDKVSFAEGSKRFQVFYSSLGNLDDFPLEPAAGTFQNRCVLDLAALVAPVLHAVAVDDSRYGLNGVNVEIYSETSAAALATDGHRAVWHCLQRDRDCPPSVLIPRKEALTLKQTFPGNVVLSTFKNTYLDRLTSLKYARPSDNRYRICFDFGQTGYFVERKECEINVVPSVVATIPFHRNLASLRVACTPELLEKLLRGEILPASFLGASSCTGDKALLQALVDDFPSSSWYQIQAEDESVVLTSCGADGEFPDVRQVFRDKHEHECLLPVVRMQETLSYLGKSVGANVSVYLVLSEKEVRAYSLDPELCIVEDTFQAESRGSSPFTIGAQNRYLQEALKFFGSRDSGKLRMLCSSELHAILFAKPEEDPYITGCLVMPVRLK